MKTKEEFITKSKQVHGDKYNYSKVEYVDNNTKVCIICPIHGEFWQTPKSHAIRKYGCKKCGRELCGDKRRKGIKQFINEANILHNNRYDYSKVNYVNVFTRVTIICPIHGEFEQTPHDHLKGAGCKKCASEQIKKMLSDTKEGFIAKAKQVHGDKYNYSKVEYINQNTDVTIICPIHGEFKQTPNNHLNGEGCRACGIERTKYYKNIKKPYFVKKCNLLYGDFYDYTKTDLEYRDSDGKVTVTCPIHGDFKINPSWHLSGHGCRECGNIKSANSKRLSKEEFITKSKEMHGDKYDYSKVVYKTTKTNVDITCPIHGVFSQKPEKHLIGEGCPKCGNQISKAEDEIYNYCCEKIGKENVQQRNRILIAPQELDIYLRPIKYAIEYNGLRWHSEKFGKDKWYHLNKLNACKKRNIKLIQIFEDEYVNKKEIVYNKIKHIIKLDQNLPKIPGRKCTIVEITNKEAQEFLNKYHIQGYARSTVYLGCYYNNGLIAVMSFKRETKTSNRWELTRFATDYKYICQGVGGKLFNYFLVNYKPEEIKSFADRRWTVDEDNNIYTKLGFQFDSYTNPDYHYFNESDGIIRQHKFGFRKQKLHKKYGLPLSMTEEQMTQHLGYTKIYDCGLIKYIWKK